ncbi:hypothetical protein TBR22_A51400 [Luteitalea sp. TBR-22]|uniref:hypothetical protein n=1 Tax=Luteitalea sp. TBR-22 TaxID=2802971 RepID=UPI001AF9AD9F|nr:hypothetical protein [Luteitalea sp. TBR-22]BCS35905.1 hypothetical protein TBR22_A51400 [Luteitalea sp. TBR-22]
MRHAIPALVLLATTLVGAQGRLAPPPFVTCDRNELTSYTGRVTSLRREKQSTRLVIETDEATTERVVIAHPDGDLLSAFHLRGQPFTEADMARLMPGGRLVKDARATVWVCTRGMRPQVDWSF